MALIIVLKYSYLEPIKFSLHTSSSLKVSSLIHWPKTDKKSYTCKFLKALLKRKYSSLSLKVNTQRVSCLCGGVRPLRPSCCYNASSFTGPSLINLIQAHHVFFLFFSFPSVYVNVNNAVLPCAQP